VGQVGKMLPRLEGGWQDKLFCAGEYSSPGFYGYMEGGLHSGAVLVQFSMSAERRALGSAA
jgi:hypothetical protein